MQRTFFMETDRLGFSHWAPEDAPLANALWGNAEVVRYLSAGGAFTRQQIETRLALEIEGQRQFGVQYWPLFTKGDSAFAGCCGLRPWQGEENAYELGFHLLPPFWGAGYGREAAAAAIAHAHAFKACGAAALYAGHHPHNAASGRLLAKLGFVYLRDAHYPPTGLHHPTYRYGGAV